MKNQRKKFFFKKEYHINIEKPQDTAEKVTKMFKDEGSMLKAIEEEKTENEPDRNKKEAPKEKDSSKKELRLNFKKLAAFENKKIKIFLMTDEIIKITEKKKFVILFFQNIKFL